VKKGILIISSILFLTACSSSDNTKTKTQSPKIPTGKTLQANVLGALDVKTDNNVDVKKLVDQINQNIERENIAAQDIERGWYYATTKDDKKWGTPNSWIWKESGERSRFMSPHAEESDKETKIDAICKQTAGIYVRSCANSDSESCEYIPTNECRCTVGSKWLDGQGCILAKGNRFIKISKEESSQGWYYGLNSEKKLDTPSNWVWKEDGRKSMWRNK